MHHKKSKTWDMQLWWLKDRMIRQHFKIFWDVGGNNWADYFTKHFARSTTAFYANVTYSTRTVQ